MIQPSDYIIVVVGKPGAGKTTTAKKLSEEFGIPLFSTDDYQDYEFEEALGKIIEDILNNAGPRFIVEGVQAFRLLRAWERQDKYPDLVINVIADEPVRVARWKAREGNEDKEYPEPFATWCDILWDYYKGVAGDVKIINYDTTKL